MVRDALARSGCSHLFLLIGSTWAFYKRKEMEARPIDDLLRTLFNTLQQYTAWYDPGSMEDAGGVMAV